MINRGRKHISSKYKGQTFASVSKKISDKYPNRETNPIEMRSFMMEIEEVMKLQEAAKIREMAFERIKDNKKPSSTKEMEMGGELPEYGLGGDPGNPMMNPLNPLAAMAKAIVGTKDNPNPIFGSQVIAPAFGKFHDMVSARIHDPMNKPLEPLATPLQLRGIEQSKHILDPVTTTEQTNATGPNWLKDNIYAPVALGKALEFAGKASMLIGGPDKVSPVNNPYESQIRTIMQGRNVNLDQARQDAITTQNAVSNTPVRSQAVREAIIQNAYGQGLDTLGNISTQQDQINNQYKGDNASTLGSLGQQRVAAQNYAENLNNQSKVGYQMGLQSILESVGQTGQVLTDHRAAVAQQKMLAEVLRTRNFKTGDAGEILKKAENGQQVTLDDFIKILGADEGSKAFQELRTKLLGKGQ